MICVFIYVHIDFEFCVALKLLVHHLKMLPLELRTANGELSSTVRLILEVQVPRLAFVRGKGASIHFRLLNQVPLLE